MTGGNDAGGLGSAKITVKEANQSCDIFPLVLLRYSLQQVVLCENVLGILRLRLSGLVGNENGPQHSQFR